MTTALIYVRQSRHKADGRTVSRRSGTNLPRLAAVGPEGSWFIAI
jgi:hypothetical protein